MRHKGAVGIAGLLGLVVFVLVALSLAAPVANQSEGAALNANVTAAGASLARIIPLVFIVFILMVIVGGVALR